jgi:hypothetical protein
VDDIPVHIVVVHKLRSTCTNDSQPRAVQSNRRMVECMLLVGRRIAVHHHVSRRERLS